MLEHFYTIVKQWQEKNTLLRVSYSKKKVGQIVFSGRVLQVSENQQQLLIYNVDKKSVESIDVHAIDDMIPFEE
ncbi:hypothetical protein [Bacillus weihaiensis]|uniref:YolD-like family protein n=1 Tax=Bacillus weihaiensis TaxID=1547283 RepID=A0A1L3MQI3_9BACI|nr:hypothetical protein [Bacillus weihaiensis]APH04514.1 hypothetical protein A9C19_07000 [Bacillus weihaiensis]